MAKAWNKGRSVGPKKAFTAKQVSLIKQLLGQKGSVRDLALFSLAIDSMLRSCDLLDLRLSDLRDSNGEYRRGLTVKQQKTKNAVYINISETTIQALAAYATASNIKSSKPLFGITHRHYTRLVKKWAKMIHLAEEDYSTHSLRRTKATYIYKKTNNLKGCQELLGHKSIASTGTYLEISKQEASNLAREYEI